MQRNNLLYIVNFIWITAFTMMVSCTDNHIWPSTPDEELGEGTGIAFSGVVKPSRTAVDTRADGSLVNRLETQLLPTQKRTYYLWDNSSEAVVAKEAEYYVGVYGCYTGDNTWNALKTLAAKASPTAAEKQKLSDYYSANFFYNQQATIGADGLLTYTPERFWPNNKIGSSDEYQRASFWAYYPWNPTVSGVGAYGISITADSEGVTTGNGMGKVKFTMHPDAAEQNDFLVSELTADCSKNLYPLNDDGAGGWMPARVPLVFHHMLAQVRLYAFIQGRDRVVYVDADETWYDAWPVGGTVVDDLGNVLYTKTAADEVTNASGATMNKTSFVDLELKVPDETNSVRWYRNPDIRNLVGDRNRAEIFYSMSFNNIHTQAVYTPTVAYDAGTDTYTTKIESATTDAATGSATVNHFILNPYWFRFKDNKRVMLNETYMYDYFEDTPAYKATTMTAAEIEQDGVDWSTKGSNCLGYTGKKGLDYATDNETAKEVLDRSGNYPTKHYNYPPGNIIMAVPQQLTDDDVPNIVITAKGYRQRDGKEVYTLSDGTTNIMVERDGSGNITATYDWDGTDRGSTTLPTGATRTVLTAKVTINMLQMNIKWEAGFIYCYAFLDELMPGDDKVRGPETIVVVFDPDRYTDQW